jgi:CubicO group peptidase (beta-lactamase class C family)
MMHPIHRSLCAFRITAGGSLLALAMLSAVPGQASAEPATAVAEATVQHAPPTQEALAELTGVVDEYLEGDLIVGAELLVISQGEVVLHETFGDSDADEGTAWAKDTICNIRSMTKALTGAAAQILIDRGQLSLDDRVAEYLPGFDTDEARMITVGQLMSHRSGLPLSIMLTPDDMTKYEDLIAQGNAVGEAGPEFEPGSKFWYSDAGTDALGAVVQSIAGEPLDVFWQREIFDPLGMNDTLVPRDMTDPRYDRIASLYVGGPHRWVRFWAPEEEPFYPFAWGSQTVYSTPRDYAKFIAMWMDGGQAPDGEQLLSPAAIARTLEPTSPMSMLGSDERYPTEFRGLELWYGRMAMLYQPTDAPRESAPVIVGHGGSDGTMAWGWPDRDLMVMYFTQSRGGLTVLRLEKEIDRLLIHPGEALPEVEVPDAFKPFVGVYIANFATFQDERFTVLVKDGKLALDIPSQLTFELLDPTPDGRYPFAVAPQQVSVEFELGADGTAQMLRLHQGGMVFEVPREGSAMVEAQRRQLEVDPEAVQPFVGTYHDPEAGADVEVYVEERVLCIKAPPGIVFHLVPTEDANRFTVKELPIATLTFDVDESGAARSMTREIDGAILVMPRKAADGS